MNRVARSLGVVLSGLCLVSTTLAQDAISTDISVLNTDGEPISDHVVARYSGASALAIVEDLGLPPAADLAALHLIDDSNLLFSLKSTTQLGAVTARPGDVIRWREGAFSVEVRSADLGLDASTAVDALTANGADLVFSINTTSRVNGVAVTDSDLLRWSAASGSALWLEQSRCGIPESADVAAAHLMADGDVLMAFKSAVELSGAVIRKGEIARCTPASGAVVRHRTFNEISSAWVAAGIDALSQLALDLLFKDGFESLTQ